MASFDSLYSVDQIEVPKELPGILRAYTKEVIRFNPTDIPAFSRDYFDAMTRGELHQWLAEQQKKKEDTNNPTSKEL